MSFSYRLATSIAFSAVITTAVTTANANEKRTAKPVKGKVATMAPEKWVPEVYDPTWTKLPPGYQGVDPVKVNQLLNAMSFDAKKGEFETTEQFQARISDADANLAPLNRKSYYAFKIDSIASKYDADAQVFRVSQNVLDACKESERPKGWMVCQVKTVYRDNEGYEGSNAYGATRHIAKDHRTVFGVAIPLGGPALGLGTFNTNMLSGGAVYYANVPVPIEKAKSLKASKLGVLFIGNVQGGKQITVTNIRLEPKMDSLLDAFIYTSGVPFDMKKIVVYVVETGEILEQRDFDLATEN